MLREIDGHGGTAEAFANFPRRYARAASRGGRGDNAPRLHGCTHGGRTRSAADTVKHSTPILAIFGNPPYRRLRRGEVERLVGADMAQRWRDLTQPVRDAGFGRSLNAFPDLYIAFYRWALWRLFEADGAHRRGVLGFITNRGFLVGRGFGGLRRMLRRRFDAIRVLDLRGDSQGTRPRDGRARTRTCSTFRSVSAFWSPIAGGTKPAEGSEARDQLRRRVARLVHSRGPRSCDAADRRDRPNSAAISGRYPGETWIRLKPPGFAGTDWPGSRMSCWRFRSNGIVTLPRRLRAMQTTEGLAWTAFNSWLQIAAQNRPASELEIQR